MKAFKNTFKRNHLGGNDRYKSNDQKQLRAQANKTVANIESSKHNRAAIKANHSIVSQRHNTFPPFYFKHYIQIYSINTIKM